MSLHCSGHTKHGEPAPYYTLLLSSLASFCSVAPLSVLGLLMGGLLGYAVALLFLLLMAIMLLHFAASLRRGD